MNMFSAFLALIFLMGIVGDKNERNKRYYTIGFVCCMITIIMLNNR